MERRIVHRLRDTFRRRRVRRHHHTNRILETRLDQTGHIGRKGGRKEQRLPLQRQGVKNLIDLWRKAHIKHTVGFIQHQNLDGKHIDRPVPHMVQQPPRRGDQDVGPLAQAPDLRLHIAPSDNDRRGDVVAPAQLLD